MRVYIGTYTNGKSKGIYLYDLDTATGALKDTGLTANTANPSFLALAPNGRHLYAANEIDSFGGKPSGSVTAFAVDAKTGGLTLLNEQPSGGSGPCHVAVDRTGKNVLVANYNNGSVACLPIEADGKLKPPSAEIQHHGSSVNKERQEGPHAHSVYVSADNHTVFAADLGLDKFLIYRFDAAKGTLTPNETPFVSVAPGAGCRHAAFAPNGRHAYLINELNSTLTSFDFDAKTATFKEIQTLSTLPADFQGNNSTAEIQITPNGKFLYGSNRGHNSLALFAIDAATGKLKLVEHRSTEGKTPRDFRIDPTGTFLIAANQDTDNVVVFHINPTTGQLAPTGSVAEIPMPVCVQIVK